MEFGDGEVEFFVPGLAETADQRFFQVFVEWYAFLLTSDYSGTAYVPTVVIEPPVVAQFFYADGVEVAGYRFLELAAAFTEGFLNGAIAASIFAVAGEDAVLAVYNRCDKLAFRIGVCYTLTVDDLAGFNGQVCPYRRQESLYLCDFLCGDGCAGISLNAAGTFAAFQIATEAFGQYIV